MKFIGIEKVWYGAVFAAAVTPTTLAAWIKAATTTEVKNVHGDTWGYTQDDHSVTDYVNGLTGGVYHQDIIAKGKKTISFTMGEYEFSDLVALQGGSVVQVSSNDVGYAEGAAVIISKGIVAKTKTGNYIVFSNANIIGKDDFVEKNLGLGVKAVAMESSVTGVAASYKFDGSKVTVT